MPFVAILFVLCLIVGFSPILATTLPSHSEFIEQQGADKGLPLVQPKLDLGVVDPDTMDVNEQPEGFDTLKK